MTKNNLKKLILTSLILNISIFSAKAMNQNLNQSNQSENNILNQEIDFNKVDINNLYENKKMNVITSNIVEFLKDEKSSEFKDLRKSNKAGWSWSFLTKNLYSNFYKYVIYEKFFTMGFNSYMSNLEEIEDLGKLYEIVNVDENNKKIDFNIERIKDKKILNKLKNIIKIYSNKDEEAIKNLTNREIKLFELYLYIRKFVEINNNYNGII